MTGQQYFMLALIITLVLLLGYALKIAIDANAIRKREAMAASGVEERPPADSSQPQGESP
jgi:hypothetical protein